jgi:hypothetical protein
VNVALLQDNINLRYIVSKLTHLAIFGTKKPVPGENDLPFQKANRLLAMSHGNIITGLTFSRHSSGIFGELPAKVKQLPTKVKLPETSEH